MGAAPSAIDGLSETAQRAQPIHRKRERGMATAYMGKSRGWYIRNRRHGTGLQAAAPVRAIETMPVNPPESAPRTKLPRSGFVQ